MTDMRTTTDLPRGATIEAAALALAQARFGPTAYVTRLTGETGRHGFFQAHVPVRNGGMMPIGASFLV
jgi:hypothetical protein